MKGIINIWRFYRATFLQICVLNLVIFILFQSYFEEYEGIFSSFVQGVYTYPAVKEWNADVHFFLYAAYSYLNQFMPDIQVYGYFLFISNWLSLILVGLVLFRIFRVNLQLDNKWLLLALYLILSMDNMISLSTNRIAFTLLVASFALVESRRHEHKSMSNSDTALFSIIVLFAALLRFDFAILAAMIYFLLQLLHKSVNKYSFIAVFLSVFVALLYNVIMMNIMSEARQIYYYKELDFIMRSNFDYASLTDAYKMEVDAFYNYIFDDVHLTWNFYNAISVRGKGEGIVSLFFGLHWKSFLNTLSKSIPEYRMAWYYILFSFGAGIFVICNSVNRKYWILHLLLMLLFPLLVCFYVVTPLRFLVPYYSLLGVYYVIVLVRQNKTGVKWYLFLSLILLFVVVNSFFKAQKYRFKEEQVKENMVRLQQLYKLTNDSVPVVINNFNQEKFFPVNALDNFSKQNVLFQNLYYFMSYDCYIDRWKEYCHCNPLSLKDKIDYIVKNKNLFVVDEVRLGYLKGYLRQKYGVKVQAEFIREFDNDLDVYRITYEESE